MLLTSKAAAAASPDDDVIAAFDVDCDEFDAVSAVTGAEASLVISTVTSLRASETGFIILKAVLLMDSEWFDISIESKLEAGKALDFLLFLFLGEDNTESSRVWSWLLFSKEMSESSSVMIGSSITLF